MAERERLDISCKEAPIDYLAFFHFLHGGVPGPMEFDLWHAQGGPIVILLILLWLRQPPCHSTPLEFNT